MDNSENEDLLFGGDDDEPSPVIIKTPSITKHHSVAKSTNNQ